MFHFERTLAIRHLRSGGWQTFLTVSAVAAGVVVVVFISSMVFGMQSHWTEIITDLMPSVTVSVKEPAPDPLPASAAANGFTTSRIERQDSKIKRIEDWIPLTEEIRGIRGVKEVAPAVTGQMFATHGGRQIGAMVYGAEPARLNLVMSVTKYLAAGRYLDLTGGEIVINYKLAEDLGVRIGDRIRVMSSEGRSDNFLIQGLYDPGDEQLSTVFITLRDAQSLFATGTAVEALLIRTDRLFEADAVAERIRAAYPYKVESWIQKFPSSASMISSIGATGVLISAFSLFAASFAIAAVLIVSVLQKGKQIGILKSIGAKNNQILSVFLLEGLGIAIVGSAIGAILGSAVSAYVASFRGAPHRPGARTQPIYPCDVSWQIIVAAIGAAILVTLLAAMLPARRAARLNPVDAMR